MSRLEEFVSLLTGRFNNDAQYQEKQKEGLSFPYAEHVNTVCNQKIDGLPADFAGVFMVEESYYTTASAQSGAERKFHTSASHHLFLFTEEPEGIRLTSYELPQGYTKDNFVYDEIGRLDYASLQPSAKFTPALYVERDGVWEGGSVSHFSPVLTFTLYERFSSDCLEVSEKMEVQGKPTFGYDEPIRYRRAD